MGVSTSREPSIHQESSYRLDDFRALAEGVADAVVDDQINVTLPVPDLDVLQAMIFFGQRTQILAEQDDFFDQ